MDAEIHVSNVVHIDGDQKNVTVDNKNEHLRMRQTKSIARVEEITKEAEKAGKSQADKPYLLIIDKLCHRPRDSQFSCKFEFRDFTGYANWGFLLLMMGGLRLTLENLPKYGIRIDPFQRRIVLNGGTPEVITTENPYLILFAYINANILLTLWVKKLLVKEKIKWKQAFTFLVIYIITHVIPAISNWMLSYKSEFIGNAAVCSIYTITFLKLWYCINADHLFRRDIDGDHSFQACRRGFSVTNEVKNDSQGSGRVDAVVHYYLANSTIRDLFPYVHTYSLQAEFFAVVPSRIRKRFLLKPIF